MRSQKRHKLILNYTPSRAHLLVFAAALAGVGVLILVKVFAFTLNGVQLDNGTCGQDLQQGAVVTDSSSYTPSFLLTGDGGLSSYSVFIDGKGIGTFNSDGFGRVCITTSSPLSEGAHTLTAQELKPNPSNAVPAFSFAVDAVPLAPPSTPTLDIDSQSAGQGGNYTAYDDPNLDGTSTPSVPIRILENGRLVGGCLALANGTWVSTTDPLPQGLNLLTAVTVNPAGVQSAPSGTLALYVITTPPAATPTPAQSSAAPSKGSGSTSSGSSTGVSKPSSAGTIGSTSSSGLSTSTGPTVKNPTSSGVADAPTSAALDNPISRLTGVQRVNTLTRAGLIGLPIILIATVLLLVISRQRPH